MKYHTAMPVCSIVKTITDNLFSQHSQFFAGQSKKFKLKCDWRHTLPGELAGESVTK